MHFLFAFINIFVELLQFAIILRVIFSWINIDKSSRIFQFVRDVSEPVLGFFQSIVPRIGMFDISPIIALLSLDFLRMLLLSLF